MKRILVIILIMIMVSWVGVNAQFDLTGFYEVIDLYADDLGFEYLHEVAN